jgi:hypothetical protein
MNRRMAVSWPLEAACHGLHSICTAALGPHRATHPYIEPLGCALKGVASMARIRARSDRPPNRSSLVDGVAPDRML